MSDELRDRQAVGGGLKAGAFRPVPVEVLRAVGPGPGLTYAALTRCIDKGRDHTHPLSIGQIAAARGVCENTAREQMHKLSRAALLECAEMLPDGRRSWRLFVNGGKPYSKGNDPLAKGQTADGWVRVPDILWETNLTDAAKLMVAYCLSLTRRCSWKAVMGILALRSRRALDKARVEAKKSGWLDWQNGRGQKPMFTVTRPAEGVQKSIPPPAEKHTDPLQKSTIPPAEKHTPTDQEFCKSTVQEHQPDESKLRNSKRLPDELSRLVFSHFGEKARQRLEQATATARTEHGDALANEALSQLTAGFANVGRSPARYFEEIVRRLTPLYAAVQPEQREVLDQLADVFGPGIVREFATSPAYSPFRILDAALKVARDRIRKERPKLEKSDLEEFNKAVRQLARELYIDVAAYKQPDKVPTGIMPSALYLWTRAQKGRDLAAEFKAQQASEAPERGKVSGISREVLATVQVKGRTEDTVIAEHDTVGAAWKALAALSLAERQNVGALREVLAMAHRCKDQRLTLLLNKLLLEADPGPAETLHVMGVRGQPWPDTDELPVADGEATDAELELAEVA